MSLTVCAFALPYKIDNGPHFEFKLASATAVQVTVPDGVYYPDHDTGAASNLLKAITTALTTADTTGTWSFSEVAGDYRGRWQIARAQGAGETLEYLKSLTSEISMIEAGFSTASVVPDSGTESSASATFTPSDRFAGSWVLGSLNSTELFVGALERPQSHTVITTSPGGVSTVDNYGDLTTKTIELSTLQAASVYPFFSGELSYMNKIGATIGDENAAFDTLRSRWADLDTSIGNGRFYPDIDAPSSYVEVQPGQGHQWIQSLDNAAVEISRSPLLYDLSITVFVV